MQHAPDAVRALYGEGRLPVRAAVETRPPLDQLADEARAVLDEGLHGGFVAEAVAGSQCVGGVELG